MEKIKTYRDSRLPQDENELAKIRADAYAAGFAEGVIKGRIEASNEKEAEMGYVISRIRNVLSGRMGWCDTTGWSTTQIEISEVLAIIDKALNHKA